MDAVSTPGGEELDQPGGRRVGDGGLEAAAAQDQQRVLLRVQAGGGGSRTPGHEPQDERRLEVGAEHREGGEDPRGRESIGSVGCLLGVRKTRRGAFFFSPTTYWKSRGDMRAAAPLTSSLRVFLAESGGGRSDVSLRAEIQKHRGQSW